MKLIFRARCSDEFEAMWLKSVSFITNLKNIIKMGPEVKQDGERKSGELGFLNDSLIKAAS